jgi:S-adenosylmethionine synthetase
MEGFFTSESVSEGHPDKVADQIADSVLDAMLMQDPEARVACDVLVKNNTVIVAGEITAKVKIDLESVVRNVIKDIGYNDPALGFDANTCTIFPIISQQSEDIAQGINHDLPEELGAGDQGSVIGYACTETDVFMPAPIFYAHQLVKQQSLLRKSRKIPWLLPDAKSQVTFKYVKDKPVEVATIVFSTQHQEGIDLEMLREIVREEIIKPVFNGKWLTDQTQYFINPAGRFLIGGPAGDCGLTGRKTVVDSYGGMARDGGGCFSGKDPSKVDRSAAYAARYIAKNIVGAGLASRCEIQISYAIGVSKPLGIHVETFGTGDDIKLIDLIQERFDLRPFAIISSFDLKRPIYLQTAAYGHFGRPDFAWEKVDANL